MSKRSLTTIIWACHLSGLFAAKMSKTGKIGYIGGVSLPPLNADVNALKAAIASVNPKDTFTSAFAGSFQDPAKGHEIASQMYQGVYHRRRVGGLYVLPLGRRPNPWPP